MKALYQKDRKEQTVKSPQIERTEQSDLKRLKATAISKNDDGKEKDKDKPKSMLPPILQKDDPVELKSLKGTLMTKDKFGNEFETEKWEDAQYVRRISEYGNRDIQYNIGRLKRNENVIKKSFVGEKKFGEDPDMYRNVKSDQFTDIVIPYKQEPEQINLWKDYKTNNYHDVEYKEKARLKNFNYEVVTQLNGKKVTYEKVI